MRLFLQKYLFNFYSPHILHIQGPILWNYKYHEVAKWRIDGKKQKKSRGSISAPCLDTHHSLKYSFKTLFHSFRSHAPRNVLVEAPAAKRKNALFVGLKWPGFLVCFGSGPMRWVQGGLSDNVCNSASCYRSENSASDIGLLYSLHLYNIVAYSVLWRQPKRENVHLASCLALASQHGFQRSHGNYSSTSSTSPKSF